MKKSYFYIPLVTILLASCVSQKKFTELQALQDSTKDLLNSTTVKLNTCDEDKAAALASVASLQEQIRFLKENNSDLIDNLGNLTTLSQKGAENLEKSLESLK
jgi:chemotaxis protein MotB